GSGLDQGHRQGVQVREGDQGGDGLDQQLPRGGDAGRAADALRWVQAVRHRAGVGAGGDGDVHGDEERFAEAELSGAQYKAKASTHSETATSTMTATPNPWHVACASRSRSLEAPGVAYPILSPAGTALAAPCPTHTAPVAAAASEAGPSR